ncbi:MAG: phosphopentomutase, partial [Sporomusaceae bacterium]|nr:phosphopentomutase [Sporomusaceae bacterium]
MFKRVIVIVLDSVGIGVLPDAAEYGDFGANTISNIAQSQNGLFLPTMETMGLGSIEQISGVKKLNQPIGSFGKMAEISKGKDTTT